MTVPAAAGRHHPAPAAYWLPQGRDRDTEMVGSRRRRAQAGGTKTGPRTVWLNEAARAILDRQPRTGSRYVFSSSKDPARPCTRDVSLWFRARKEAGIEDVRLHDLRHTVASQAVAQSIAVPCC